MPLVAPRRTVPLVLALAALVSGCGGGDDAATQVADGLRRGFTTDDPAVLCQQTLSAGLAQRIYGSAASCLESERRAAATRTPAASVRVSEVVVHGDRANAFVVLVGGDAAGTRGAVSLVRRDGRWRLDALSTGFLRSGLKSGLVDNPQVSASLRDCLSSRLDTLDDAIVRRLGLAAMGARAEGVQGMQALIRECVEAPAPSGGDAA